MWSLGRRQSRTGMTEKEALKQMRKPMIHLGSFETNEKQAERKLSGNLYAEERKTQLGTNSNC